MQKRIPLTLLPSLSSGGDQHMTPITLGTTSRMPPDTPDLAGRPTWRSSTPGGGYHGHRDYQGYSDTVTVLQRLLFTKGTGLAMLPTFYRDCRGHCVTRATG